MTFPAETPVPPYYAVIFTSTRTPGDEGYGAMADHMEQLAATMPGFLGVESVRDAGSAGAPGITVAYWASLEAIAGWKAHGEHQLAQRLGRERWYEDYRVRVCKVEREYGFSRAADAGAPAGEAVGAR
ncbi:hypothetical protein BKK79_30295 [Cupriavidus sp. USMAA2-4]|uniref:antibiotic biosynthesis monooxygenase family protein n=1 Tax=Cupriavidus sp. USMAA2-4 TaxID=876364 RepID=UPI0008A70847|nr:antibiotic biosynthesis monooxygenase [Cupriavidus sp. USMAA2-4]AOY95963.1 hypothetical protein BKK79_30295 [Cupriavidus sp. USMAA2-4]